MRIAVIVPAGEAAAPAVETLRALRGLRRHGHRVILVDSGGGAAAAATLADRIVFAPAGWSRQANAGSRTPEAEGADALLFLPPGVRLPPRAGRGIARALANARSPWGRFDVRYRHRQGILARPLALAAALANGLARWTGVCTREQAIFVSRGAFLAIGGFAAVDPARDRQADEAADMAFSLWARRLGPPCVVRGRATVDTTVSGLLPLLRAVLRREARRLRSASGFAGAAPR